MKNLDLRKMFFVTGSALGATLLVGCGMQPVTSNVNLANANTRSNSFTSNSNAPNTNTNSADTSSASHSSVDAKEPDQYQATVTVKVEGIGDQQKTALPTLSAAVARNSTDRRMEFTMPAGGRVVFLDKAGTNYLILPEKKQYAELTQDALGFQVRRMLMPEQIVQQVKTAPGMQLVGDDKYNGRDVTKYSYAGVADTQSKAGQVNTQSFLLVDKATGLPLHSETTSQAQPGAGVQGFNGIRIVTEIADIKTDPSGGLFDLPAGYQKIESEQIRAQVDMVFNALAAFATQMMRQTQPGAATSASPAG